MSERDKLCAAVSRIAWGYILMHFNITIGGLDILPDWAGYLLIYQALPVLAEKDESAGLLRPLGLGLTVWKVITWVMGIIGASIDSYILNIVVTVVSLYFHFQLLTNLAGIAVHYDCPQSGTLLRLRTVQTVLSTVTQLLLYGVDVQTEVWQVIVMVFIVVQLAAVVWLCYTLFSLKRTLAETAEEINESEIDGGTELKETEQKQ